MPHRGSSALRHAPATGDWPARSQWAGARAGVIASAGYIGPIERRALNANQQGAAQQDCDRIRL